MEDELKLQKERIDDLEQWVMETMPVLLNMGNMIEDLTNRVVTLTKLVAEKIEPEVHISPEEIVACMEENGITWDEAETKLKRENNEGTKSTLHVPV